MLVKVEMDLEINNPENVNYPNYLIEDRILEYAFIIKNIKIISKQSFLI